MEKLEEATGLFTELVDNAVKEAIEQDNKELAYKYMYLHSIVMTALSVVMLVKTFQISLHSIMSVDLSNFGDD